MPPSTRLQEAIMFQALAPLPLPPPPPPPPQPAFTCFKHMPPELRRMVWDMTLPDPKFYCLKPSRTQNEKWLRIKAHPLPVTLMVSKESRNHAQLRLKRYTISTNPLGPFDAQPYGYFNPRTDVLHLPFWSNQRKLGRFPFEKFSFHLDVTQSGRVTTIIMPNLLVRLKYADKFPDIFMVMQDEMNGFKRHNSCNTWVPVGMPVIDRPWNNAFLQSLLDHRRFHEGIKSWSPVVSDMLSEAERAIPLQPSLLCRLPVRAQASPIEWSPRLIWQSESTSERRERRSRRRRERRPSKRGERERLSQDHWRDRRERKQPRPVGRRSEFARDWQVAFMSVTNQPGHVSLRIITS